MKATYKHTNIIARDWRKLAAFYENVLGCRRILPERHHSGSWIEKGTAVSGAEIFGIHLRLPGCGDDGPVLEIYQYAKNEVKADVVPNREGYGHIAFEVADVADALKRVKENGGGVVGEVATIRKDDVGVHTFVYATDPEGNIVELQSTIPAGASQLPKG